MVEVSGALQQKLTHAGCSPDVLLPFQIQVEIATVKKIESKLILAHRWHSIPVVNMKLLIQIKLIQDDVVDIIFNRIERDCFAESLKILWGQFLPLYCTHKK